jgi:hypothetical protein
MSIWTIVPISRFRDDILSCLERFPDAAEGVIELNGDEYFFTYALRPDKQVLEACLRSREVAEQMLNEHDAAAEVGPGCGSRAGLYASGGPPLRARHTGRLTQC